jgi:Conjugative transposon protein TcpC
VATALPAEVATPAQAAEPQLAYNTTIPVESGSLTSAVTQFVTAYLTGSGNLSRYLAPGTALSPVSPAPYVSIRAVTVFSTSSQPGTATETPASGTRLRVLAQVEAIDSTGHQWPFTYALILTAVAGQWDVAAIDAAPQLGPSQ